MIQKLTWPRAGAIVTGQVDKTTTWERQRGQSLQHWGPKVITPGNAGLREFRISDVAQVRRLIHRTLDISYSDVYRPRAVRFFKTFHSEAKILRRHQEGEILVVELDGKVIATGAIVEDDIFGVFVDPDFQHHGHGRALMHELEARARSKGYREAVLSVSLPSRRFYESLGYTGFEDRAIDLGDGEKLAFWHATKPLTAQDA